MLPTSFSRKNSAEETLQQIEQIVCGNEREGAFVILGSEVFDQLLVADEIRLEKMSFPDEWKSMGEHMQSTYGSCFYSHFVLGNNPKILVIPSIEMLGQNWGPSDVQVYCCDVKVGMAAQRISR